MEISRLAGERPVVLLAPPASDVTQPYTSLPALTASLRVRGFTVIQRDIGLEVLLKLLEPRTLTNSITSARLRMDRRAEDSPEFYDRAIAFEGMYEYLVENIDEAISFLRCVAAANDFKKYLCAVRTVRLACELASLPYFPTVFGPGLYSVGGDETWDSVKASAKDKERNVFLSIFETDIVPSICAYKPLLVGISITFPCQLIPGLALARQIRAASSVPIVIGGAVVQRIRHSLEIDQEAFAFADYYVFGEGESALSTIASRLMDETPPSSIPNTIHRIAGEVVCGGALLEDVRSLPCPDFRGLCLSQYLSPEPVLLVSTTRGCYYGKCAFCDVSGNARSTCRVVSKDQLVEVLKTLQQRHGVRRFFFCEDAMSPSHMSAVAHYVETQCSTVTWQAEARFERALTRERIYKLHRGGCRQLIFGLESRSARVLKLMRKNNDLENDERILSDCRNAGIAVNLQTFIGFPGECAEEAKATIDFLVNEKERIAAFGFGTFSLYRGTPVFSNPDEFGVEATTEAETLFGSVGYTVSHGISSHEAQELYGTALPSLINAYGVRNEVLGGLWGAHGLILLSSLSLNDVFDLWNRLNCVPSLPNGENAILEKRASVLVLPGHTSTCIFCPTTAGRLHITESQAELLSGFDGRLSLGVVLERWLDARGCADVDMLVNQTHAGYSFVFRLLRLEILVEKGLQRVSDGGPDPVSPFDVVS